MSLRIQQISNLHKINGIQQHSNLVLTHEFDSFKFGFKLCHIPSWKGLQRADCVKGSLKDSGWMTWSCGLDWLSNNWRKDIPVHTS